MIISVANQKGGVGKTTTTLNIGAGLIKVGKRVLLIDADPQNHLSRWLGFTPDSKPTLSDLIDQEVSGAKTNNYSDFIRKNQTENIDYIPSTRIMSGAIMILGLDNDSQNVLSRIFKQPYFSENYDYIIFDCQPSLDLLVSNILKCCDKLLIPVQSDPLAYEGVSDMLDKLQQIKQTQDIKKYILGMLITMYQKKTNVSHAVQEALVTSYGEYVFEDYIPLRTEAKQSSITRESLIKYPKSDVGQSYMNIVNKIMERSLSNG